jgi:hypothetical protein
VSPTPSGAPSPNLESGDTAPPGAAKVETLDPTHAPPLAPTTEVVGAPAGPTLVTPPPPAPRPVPFYRKNWFWGAVSVVVITGIVVSVLTVGSSSPSTPQTTLGDMRAF